MRLSRIIAALFLFLCLIAALVPAGPARAGDQDQSSLLVFVRAADQKAALEQARVLARSFLTQGGYAAALAAEQGAELLSATDLGPAGGGKSAIEALVELPIDPRKAEGSEAREPLSVRVGTDKTAYAKGETISARFSGNRDFFGRVFYLTPEGDVIQLLPNRNRSVSLFRAGRIYSLPGQGDAFCLEATPPYGLEKIVLLAADAPLGVLDTRPIGGGLSVFKGPLAEAGKGSKRLEPAKGCHEFCEAVCVFKTRDKAAERGFRSEEDAGPINMTGAAGRNADVNAQGLK
ncbi:MAG: DUF4384 domain-containing protein [Desulfovibrionaceae bacterium]|nr:DUF4384 domain-containing protein [Desulfovibrionaceae bacterium]